MSKRFQAVTIKPSDDIFEAFAEQMRQTPNLVKTAVNRQASKARSKLLPKLREEPPDPTYPLRWKTEKQKRAFFATDGFGRGIGAPRTHDISQGWKVEINNRDFVSIDVFNTNPATIFVEGDEQQPFHIDTGWIFAPQIISDAWDAFEDVLIDTYFTVADPTIGLWP